VLGDMRGSATAAGVAAAIAARPGPFPGTRLAAATLFSTLRLLLFTPPKRLERDIKEALLSSDAGDGSLARNTVHPWLVGALITARDDHLFRSIWAAAGGGATSAAAEGEIAPFMPPAYVRAEPTPAWGRISCSSIHNVNGGNGGGSSGVGSSGSSNGGSCGSGGGGSSGGDVACDEGCMCVEYDAGGGWVTGSRGGAGVPGGGEGGKGPMVVVAVVGAAHVDGIVRRWDTMVRREAVAREYQKQKEN